MAPEPATTPWLRRARWAVALAAIACLAAGLIWTYRSAMAGEVLEAVAGAAFCLSVIALACAAGAVLRLGGVMLRCAGRLDGLETRVASLEVTLDAFAEGPDLAAVDRQKAEALVAARLDRDAFPRLVSGQDEQTLEKRGPHGAPSPVTAGQRRLEQLARREMVRLRDQFGGFVRSGDYAAALGTGERIVSLFPESDLAAQFKAIRQHLLHRASGASPDEHASVI